MSICGILVVLIDCGKMEQLKALISELKVLIHLGQHVNILNALGAVTQDIRKGIFLLQLNQSFFSYSV